MIKLCDFIAEFDKRLGDAVVGENITEKAMRYALFSGGKRLRPYAVYLGALYASGGEIDEETLESVFQYGISVEMVHTYSLIHDDLPCMDDDDYRRGKKTVHREFNEWVAVLAGDALLNLAYERGYSLFDGENNPMPYLAKYAGMGGMLGGQVMDLSISKSMEELLKTYSLKTSALFKAAFIGGGIIGKANDETIRNLEKYAENLGIAFQIADDLLETEVEEQNVKRFLSDDEAKNLLKEYTNCAICSIYCNGKGEALKEFAEMLIDRKK